MIDGLIRIAISQRVLVMLMVGILIGAGLYGLQNLPIDAMPATVKESDQFIETI